MIEMVPEVEEVLGKQLTDRNALGTAGISLHGLESDKVIVRIHDCWFILVGTSYQEDSEIDFLTSYGTTWFQLQALVNAGLLSRKAYDDQNALARKKEIERDRLHKKAAQARIKEHEKKEYERLKRKFEREE